MSEFQAMKDRAVKRAMRAGAASYVERLAREVVAQVPPTTLFTPLEVAELLGGMAERMRKEEP